MGKPNDTHPKELDGVLTNRKSRMDFSKEVKGWCTTENLEKRIPIIEWIPKYSWNYLVKDLIAGLTVGLTAIPQGIAYAVVAGLPPQYGLYSGFMGCFVYFVLGSCKDITIGPTAITSLMTQNYVQSLGVEYAILLCFLTGVVISIFGLLRLGFLVEFISMPVTFGFTTAAAVTIASSQVKGLLGLSGNPHAFLDSWENTFARIGETRLWDTVLGLGTILVLVLLKKLKEFSSEWSSDTYFRLVCKRLCWLLGLARNAVVVVVGTLMAYLFAQYGTEPFKLTGTVTSGLPPFQLPPFSVTNGNSTLSFVDMTRHLGSGIITIPLISILESIAIAKAFAKGKPVDATQEMIALGLCNIMGSFVGSFPTTGSFTRTAVNSASGVVTQAGGIFTGVLVILSLSFLTSTFYYIPKAVLAGVIICAMFYMIEYRAVSTLWRTKKIDLVPSATTFLSCLFLGLEYGMLIGITVNLLFILYHSARPRVSLQWVVVGGEEVLLVTPTQSLAFPASEYIREVIVQTCAHKNASSTVVIDGTHIHYIDSTIAKGLKMVVADLEAVGHQVVFWRWKESAMITAVGYDPHLSEYFKFNNTLHHLLQDPQKESSDGQCDYQKLNILELTPL